MPINDVTSLESMLSRLRQRYALHFYMPEGTSDKTQHSIRVDLATEARILNPNAEVRARRIFMGGKDETSGPTMVTHQTAITDQSPVRAARLLSTIQAQRKSTSPSMKIPTVRQAAPSVRRATTILRLRPRRHPPHRRLPPQPQHPPKAAGRPHPSLRWCVVLTLELPELIRCSRSSAAAFLFTFVSTHLPLDQDLGSKAAKIESLSRLAPLASPVQAPYYYRESYFPVYYQVQALFHKVLPGSAVASSGYSAALCGVLYLVGLATICAGSPASVHGGRYSCF